MVMRDDLLAALEDGPKTVPEIARILGQPSHEVMVWVMSAAQRRKAVGTAPYIMS